MSQNQHGHEFESGYRRPCMEPASPELCTSGEQATLTSLQCKVDGGGCSRPHEACVFFGRKSVCCEVSPLPLVRSVVVCMMPSLQVHAEACRRTVLPHPIHTETLPSPYQQAPLSSSRMAKRTLGCGVWFLECP